MPTKSPKMEFKLELSQQTISKPESGRPIISDNVLSPIFLQDLAQMWAERFKSLTKVDRRRGEPSYVKWLKEKFTQRE